MLDQLNINIFRAINQFAESNLILDKIGIITAEYSLFVFIFILICLWFKKTKDRNAILYSQYSALLGFLLNFFITLFYFHPRPFMQNIGTLLINHAAETSFPSDHTTFMLAAAFSFLYFKKSRKTGIILSLLGLISGMSRIYCGLHYPFDILGSFLVAIISSYIIFLLKHRLQKVNKLIISLFIRIFPDEK